MGSDGMLDNLSKEQISDIVVKYKQEPTQKIARTIASEAYKISLDPNAITPFTRNAIKSGITEGVRGGKPDDITVLVFRFTADIPKRNIFAKL